MADKQVNISVGVNASGLKTGMADAANVMRQSGKEMAAAAESVSNKTRGSLENLRTSYRQTAKDAYALAMSQGQNSQAFIEATQKAGRYKDELDLVNAKIKAFSSDTPVLTSTIGVMHGLAGAFSAAQGAAALFGDNSKKLQETLLKVQGALALTQGLQAVGQLKDAWAAFTAVLSTEVIPMLTATNVLMGGGIILALGSIISNWEEIVSWISDASDGVDEYYQNIVKSNAALSDSLKFYNSIKDALLEGQDSEKAKAYNDYLKNREEGLNKVYELEKSGQKQSIAWIALWDALKLNYKNYVQKIEEIDTKHRINRAKNTGITQIGTNPMRSIFGDLQGETDKALAKFIPQQHVLDKAIIPLQNFADNVKKVANEISVSMESIAVGISDSITAMVDAAMNGGDVGAALASSLLASMGAFMKQWGTQLILVGLGAEALKASLETLNGAAAIVAGVALVAAGAVASSMGANFANSGGKTTGGYGGGYGGGGFSPNYNTMSTVVVLDGRVRGSDIIISAYNQSLKNKRTK